MTNNIDTCHMNCAIFIIFFSVITCVLFFILLAKGSINTCILK